MQKLTTNLYFQSLANNTSALALLTALRRGEVLALKWEDADLDGGELHVRFALEQVRSTVTRKEPKSERSTRTVPLSPQAIAILRDGEKIV